ncbi:MAG TPA: thioesterase family protein [Ktedonobacterales bacterium]|nr:thioesterase family protein [Ktedonobacterales bacterium]
MPSATVRIRVAFVDVDSSMRIHFTAMFRYMEVAEHELMRSLGLPYATALQSLAFPRVHLECDFQGAIRYDDELDVTARIERVGTASWTVAFAAYPPGAATSDAPTLATGRMTIVAMDPATERATTLPDELRRALSESMA